MKNAQISIFFEGNTWNSVRYKNSQRGNVIKERTKEWPSRGDGRRKGMTQGRREKGLRNSGGALFLLLQGGPLRGGGRGPSSKIARKKKPEAKKSAERLLEEGK